MKDKERLPGLPHVGEVIAMNARLSHMIEHGVRQEDPQEQLDFLQSCIDAAKRNIIRIGAEDRRLINRLIKALHQMETVDEGFLHFATRVQMALDMA